MPSQFWDLTPAELNALVEGYIKRQEVRQDEIITVAWLTAALSRAKRLPSLSKLLKKSKKKKTEEEARKDLEDLLRVAGETIDGRSG